MIGPGDSLPEHLRDTGSYNDVLAKIRDGRPMTDVEWRKLSMMVDHLTAAARQDAKREKMQAAATQKTIMGLPVVQVQMGAPMTAEQIAQAFGIPVADLTRETRETPQPKFETTMELALFYMKQGFDVPLQPITQARIWECWATDA